MPDNLNNLSREELIKYLNVVVALIKKLQDKEKNTLEELEKRINEKIISIPKGEKGDRGEVGERGEKGEMGEMGLDGNDGKDGRDGKDADVEEVAKFATERAVLEVLPQIPSKDTIEQDLILNLPKFGIQFRDGLELLQDDERIKIEAIKNLREELDELKKGYGKMGVVSGGFNYSTIDTHIVDDETPSGLVNGVNTDFVLNNIPSPASSLKVFKDGQRMKLATDYTFSGQTITFLDAPLTDTIITCDYRI